ncbi:hypothetical protein LCGC14_1112660 [marine sediment metagenome]|uniref:Glycosyl transferase family 1 domain-containing protein n=1 Tax=marine sediment metagenome TaxID=412755 RepID=A0A0F9MU66_9ZZZZ
MNILFIGYSDTANVSNRVARALNRYVGDKARVITTGPPHPFGYTEDIVLERDGANGMDEARDLVRDADWIINTGDSNYPAMFMLLAQFGVTERDRRYRWATRHGGSTLRSDPKRIARQDHEFGFERRFVAPDLFRFVRHNPRARPYLHAMDIVLPELPTIPGDKLRVCHSPSNPEIKGTAEITDAIECNVLQGPFETVFRQRAQHHIFVDQINKSIGGFGAASIEALACGLVVLCDTHHVHSAVYNWIPRPPIVPVESGDDVRAFIDDVRDKPRLVETYRRAALTWAQTYLTDACVYDYWMKNLV